jgi:hypothetical protein
MNRLDLPVAARDDERISQDFEPTAHGGMQRRSKICTIGWSLSGHAALRQSASGLFRYANDSGALRRELCAFFEIATRTMMVNRATECQ